MANYNENDLEKYYATGYQKGIEDMKKKILESSKNANPIEINGRAYFIKSDMKNLRDIFANLESEE